MWYQVLARGAEEAATTVAFVVVSEGIRAKEKAPVSLRRPRKNPATLVPAMETTVSKPETVARLTQAETVKEPAVSTTGPREEGGDAGGGAVDFEGVCADVAGGPGGAGVEGEGLAVAGGIGGGGAGAFVEGPVGGGGGDCGDGGDGEEDAGFEGFDGGSGGGGVVGAPGPATGAFVFWGNGGMGHQIGDHHSTTSATAGETRFLTTGANAWKEDMPSEFEALRRNAAASTMT